MTDARLTVYNEATDSWVPVAGTPEGLLRVETPENPGQIDGDLTVSGSAEIAGAITAAGATFGGNLRTYRPTTTPSAQLAVFKSNVGAVESDRIAFFASGNASFIGNISAQDANLAGSATFAGGKAGFTADGYLWCTTRRGDTVILDATSNGLASWADYTPPSKREQLKEHVEGTVQIDPAFGITPEE